MRALFITLSFFFLLIALAGFYSLFTSYESFNVLIDDLVIFSLFAALAVLLFFFAFKKMRNPSRFEKAHNSKALTNACVKNIVPDKVDVNIAAKDNTPILSEKKKLFLINYLGDRTITWHIDDPVKERYPDINANILYLQSENYISIENNHYVLTEKGKLARKTFRSQERYRKTNMYNSVFEHVSRLDFIGAYNERATYERESVIPHGIFIGASSSDSWSKTTEMPTSVLNYIANSKKLDFSDIQNSEKFKESLRLFDVGVSITGAGLFKVLSYLDGFEEKMGEYLSCPSLDNQLEEKCCFKNPPKLKIYFSTKVRILSFTNTKLIDKWDGNFFLGKYDCTSNLHFSMAEFEYYSTLNIPGFPKTFRTYEKHKKENSLKYLSWMKSIGERKLTQPGQ